MSNQIFSNNTLKYSDQITFVNTNGLIMPSLNPFSAELNFRKDGNTVIVKMTQQTQVTCTALDYAIILGSGTIPEAFRPTTEVTTLVLMNYGGAFVKDLFKWTFQPDGNVVITSQQSNYPAAPLPGPPFGSGTVIGIAQGYILYTMT